jgi:hypothetical protein
MIVVIAIGGVLCRRCLAHRGSWHHRGSCDEFVPDFRVHNRHTLSSSRPVEVFDSVVLFLSSTSRSGRRYCNCATGLPHRPVPYGAPNPTSEMIAVQHQAAVEIEP